MCSPAYSEWVGFKTSSVKLFVCLLCLIQNWHCTSLFMQSFNRYSFVRYLACQRNTNRKTPLSKMGIPVLWDNNVVLFIIARFKCQSFLWVHEGFKQAVFNRMWHSFRYISWRFWTSTFMRGIALVANHYNYVQITSSSYVS